MNYQKDFEETPIFSEVQRFKTPLFYIPVAIGVIGIWIAFILQVILKKEVGKNPPSDFFLIVLWIIIGIIFPYIAFKTSLITEVRQRGIYLKFIPFHLKYRVFLYEEIEKIELIKYNPLKDYGGWGIRYGKDGWAYNVSGKIGLKVYFKNGKKVLIGTKKGEEILNIISSYVQCINLLKNEE